MKKERDWNNVRTYEMDYLDIPSDELNGDVIVRLDPQKRLGDKTWSVVKSDEYPKPLGLFWDKAEAERFAWSSINIRKLRDQVDEQAELLFKYAEDEKSLKNREIVYTKQGDLLSEAQRAELWRLNEGYVVLLYPDGTLKARKPETQDENDVIVGEYYAADEWLTERGIPKYIFLDNAMNLVERIEILERDLKAKLLFKGID